MRWGVLVAREIKATVIHRIMAGPASLSFATGGVRSNKSMKVIETGQFRGGRQARFLGAVLYAVYGAVKRGSVRRLIRYMILRLEGGATYSVTIRRIFSKYHDIEVGMYTGRGCFIYGNFRTGTKIGRYTAIYKTVQRFNANHPMNLKSTHPLFYNPFLGYAEKDLLTRTELTIGNDVWIGHNAILLSGVSSIGDGAIIGAGAVVHQDVPPYAVMVGNPARVIRYRFSEETIGKLLEEKWWEKSFDELKPEFGVFQNPLEGKDSVR